MDFPHQKTSEVIFNNNNLCQNDNNNLKSPSNLTKYIAHCLILQNLTLAHNLQIWTLIIISKSKYLHVISSNFLNNSQKVGLAMLVLNIQKIYVDVGQILRMETREKTCKILARRRGGGCCPKYIVSISHINTFCKRRTHGDLRFQFHTFKHFATGEIVFPPFFLRTKNIDLGFWVLILKCLFSFKI